MFGVSDRAEAAFARAARSSAFARSPHFAIRLSAISRRLCNSSTSKIFLLAKMLRTDEKLDFFARQYSVEPNFYSCFYRGKYTAAALTTIESIGGYLMQ